MQQADHKSSASVKDSAFPLLSSLLWYNRLNRVVLPPARTKPHTIALAFLTHLNPSKATAGLQ